MVTAAYFNAFVDLVNHLQTTAPQQAAATAPQAAYSVTSTVIMRATPSPRAGQVRSFKPGEHVFPTGQKNGIWWEVDDENGNRGWLSSAMITTRN